MSENRLTFTALGALLLICIFVYASIMLATLVAYLCMGLAVLTVLFVLGALWRKWQHSGLALKEEKRAKQLANVEEYERREAVRRANEAHAHDLEMKNAQWQLQQHIALTRVHVEQYGTYLVNQDENRLMHLAPMYKPAQLKAGPTDLPPAQEAIIPARFDMRDIWHSFRPSMSQIFLGKSAAGDIIVPGNKLLHSVATGPTGGGKTNIVRMELMQLVYIGCQVTLMDIHYAPIKEDEDGRPIDWRPIINRLDCAPIYDLGVIIKWMNWLAFTELQARIDRGRNGQPIGKPIFFSIAELPSVLDEAGDKIAQPLAKILRQGRQYLVFFVGDSNDLLTSTLHMTTGPRECFRTGFYTGGDPTTAKALLDLPNGVKVNEEGLGQQGLVYVKTALHSYTQARVGWASNEALYDLFQTPSQEQIGYQSSGFSCSTVRSLLEQDERNYDEEPVRVIVDADTPDIEALQPRTEAPFSHETIMRQPLEPVNNGTDKEPKQYRLVGEEIGQFIAAYNVTLTYGNGNVINALDAIGKSGRYKAHGSEIVKTHNLRKEA